MGEHMLHAKANKQITWTLVINIKYRYKKIEIKDNDKQIESVQYNSDDKESVAYVYIR